MILFFNLAMSHTVLHANQMRPWYTAAVRWERFCWLSRREKRSSQVDSLRHYYFESCVFGWRRNPYSTKYILWCVLITVLKHKLNVNNYRIKFFARVIASRSARWKSLCGCEFMEISFHFFALISAILYFLFCSTQVSKQSART